MSLGKTQNIRDNNIGGGGSRCQFDANAAILGTTNAATLLRIIPSVYPKYPVVRRIGYVAVGKLYKIFSFDFSLDECLLLKNFLVFFLFILKYIYIFNK